MYSEEQEQLDWLNRARAYLRAHHEGVLLSDGLATRRRILHDDSVGSLILSLDTQARDAAEHVLFLPDENDDAMEVLLTLETERPLPPAAEDRFLAYHTELPPGRFVFASIDSAKWCGHVLDGEALMHPNPLHEGVPSLCRHFNRDREALARACVAATGVRPGSPVLVGVDDLGADVRARFGILRLEFDPPAEDPNDAESRLRAWADSDAEHKVDRPEGMRDAD